MIDLEELGAADIACGLLRIWVHAGSSKTARILGMAIGCE